MNSYALDIFCNINLTVIFVLHVTMPIWEYVSLETALAEK